MAAAVFTRPPRAPTVNAPKTLKATRPSSQIPDWLIAKARAIEKVDFDPAKHLRIQDPAQIYTMDSIGLGGHGISNTAASDPFSLFTPEAVLQMRREIFSEEVLSTSQYASDFAKNMIRGYGPDRAPFIYAAWHHPAVLAHISKVAGIDLVPALETDIGHVNVSVNDVDVTVQREDDSHELNPHMSAFAWHRDSYPFVCVTMLSDCTGMRGGETAMRTGSGDIIKARGPAQGTAVVMQGRYIEHQAVGGRERISMVTSFRPKDVFATDETVLTSLRGISEIDPLYREFAEYRCANLGERFRLTAERLREDAQAGRGVKFDIAVARAFLEEQKRYIDDILAELYEV